MLTPLLLLAGLAHAGPGPTAEDPFLIQCDPARAASRMGRLVPEGILPGDTGQPDPIKAAVRALFRAPDAARSMGLDPDGGFEMAMGDGRMRVALPHEPSGAGALAEHLGLGADLDGGSSSGADEPVQTDGHGLVLGSLGPSTEAPSLLQSDGHRLILGSLSMPAEVPSLLDAFPEAKGCRVHMPLPGQQMHLAAWMPADIHAPVELRLRAPSPPPEVLSAPPAAPIGGSSQATPFVVASLGVSPVDLLEDPTIRAAMAKADGHPPDVASLERILTVLPGTTLAVFMSGDGPKGVIALPIAGRRGGPARVGRITRLIARGASGSGMRVSRMGQGELRLEGRKDTITMVVQADRLLVGNHTDATLQAAAGRGDPWVTPALANLARDQPFAAVMDTGAMFPGMDAVLIEAALGASDDAWTMKLGLDGDPDMVRMIAEGVGRSILEKSSGDAE